MAHDSSVTSGYTEKRCKVTIIYLIPHVYDMLLHIHLNNFCIFNISSSVFYHSIMVSFCYLCNGLNIIFVPTIDYTIFILTTNIIAGHNEKKIYFDDRFRIVPCFYGMFHSLSAGSYQSKPDSCR